MVISDERDGDERVGDERVGDERVGTTKRFSRLWKGSYRISCYETTLAAKPDLRWAAAA